MKIGERVVLKEQVVMHNGMVYEIGHRFKIIGSDDIRGFNLEDDGGNRLDETRFLSLELDPAVQRDKKIKTILE